ncbi:hypothetical protein EFY79_14385 [Hanamia caeni]|uniref:Uncharacterized protein n=1 Tax=Hanamia caeni TaxID=2294116 RepID=A0A3M9NAM3_9BACT|nr:hypothetical protein [Hanamia caeni]RNI34862.1 hypothetical protein EFY79_14385 [Hanamia caeni]
MSTFETVITLFLFVLLLAFVWILTEFSALKKQIDEHKNADSDTLRLRLQAYERITLLTERIALQNLLSRQNNPGLSCRQMQMSLIDAIKQEYDYNMSQQIYVSPEVWRAVNNLKEQNIYIINQLAATLPPQASGMDLNKHIIDYLINNSNASLHNIVLEAINYEAKKIM